MPHGILKALDVAVDVLVEQGEEQAEVFRVAFVGRGRHQEEVVGHLGELFPELVGEGLLIAGVGGHLVGFIDDHEVPSGTEQAVAGIFDPGRPGRPRRST